MQTADIQSRWLQFFGDRGHTVVPSASLVSDDPSLLFTVAGMVPFIPYLTGIGAGAVPARDERAEVHPHPRHRGGRQARRGTARSSRCSATGRSATTSRRTRSRTPGSCSRRRESDGGLGFAAEGPLGHRLRGRRRGRGDLARRGRPAGRPHPAARLRRQLLDRPASPARPVPTPRSSSTAAPRTARDGGPATDDDRYVEIWNLVFMQYLIANIRSKEDFESSASCRRRTSTPAWASSASPSSSRASRTSTRSTRSGRCSTRRPSSSGRRYGAEHEDDVRMRVVADHVRSVADADARRRDAVATRAAATCCAACCAARVRAMRLLGVEEATFAELFPASRDAMARRLPRGRAPSSAGSQRLANARGGDLPPHARRRHDDPRHGGREDARRPAAASSRATPRSCCTTPTASRSTSRSRSRRRPGSPSTAPRSTGSCSEQRTRAKADAKAKKTRPGRPLRLHRVPRAGRDGVPRLPRARPRRAACSACSVDGVSVPSIALGDIAEVILAETTLYAESGGQDADAGRDRRPRLRARGARRAAAGRGPRQPPRAGPQGEVAVGDAATSVVDPLYRRGATQAHSATHLIHAALRQVLGPDAHQAGSYNKAGYMRLDFSWNAPLSPETRSEVEDIANRRVDEDLEVVTRVLPIDEAKALGAMALFGEKYGDVVRMVDIGGPWSRELCGGTHVAPLVRDRPHQRGGRVVGRRDQPADRVPGRTAGVPGLRGGAGARRRSSAAR